MGEIKKRRKEEKPARAGAGSLKTAENGNRFPTSMLLTPFPHSESNVPNSGSTLWKHREKAVPESFGENRAAKKAAALF